MHKIFAKPLFLGKKILFLPQCHSTNQEMMSLVKESNEAEGFVVYTDHQKKGRGQRGNAWVDEPGKNILMSVLLKPSFLNPSSQYLLNLIVGLAVLDALKHVIPEHSCRLKWPNDVYVDDKKLGGILIESNLKGSKLEHCVLGLGLNVNQSGFSLLNATSLFIESGVQFDRLDVMEKILLNLEKWYLKLRAGEIQLILDSYHKNLLWKDEVHLFKVNEKLVEGIIKGIDTQGKLRLYFDSKEQLFDIKEIEFVS